MNTEILVERVGDLLLPTCISMLRTKSVELDQFARYEWHIMRYQVSEETTSSTRQCRTSPAARTAGDAGKAQADSGAGRHIGGQDVVRVTVEVAAGPVIPHRGARISVRPGHRDAGGLGEPVQAAGGRMAVHPGAAGVQEDRPADPGACSPVDGPADRGRQRDQDDLGALAAHAQHSVAVLLAEVGDVRAGGLEDPQAEQPEHGHQREVAWVR